MSDDITMESMKKDLQDKASAWRQVATELEQIRNQQVMGLTHGNSRSPSVKIFRQLGDLSKLADEEAKKLEDLAQ